MAHSPAPGHVPFDARQRPVRERDYRFRMKGFAPAPPPAPAVLDGIENVLGFRIYRALRAHLAAQSLRSVVVEQKWTPKPARH
jgi:hypothetical protein